MHISYLLPFHWYTTPFLLGSATSFLVLESCHSQCPRPLPWIDTPPNHSPQASGDSGLSKGWAHQAGPFYMFLYACWERKQSLVAGIAYLAGCMGRHFPIPKSADTQITYIEGAELTMQRNSPVHIFWATEANWAWSTLHFLFWILDDSG